MCQRTDETTFVSFNDQKEICSITSEALYLADERFERDSIAWNFEFVEKYFNNCLKKTEHFQ